MVLSKPSPVSSYKTIASLDRPNPREAKQETAQFLTGRGLRVGPQPTAALMLNVVKTSLNFGMGPKGGDRFESGSLPICRKGKRIQTTLFETLKPLKEGFKPFLGHVQVREDGLISKMHECHQTTVPVEIGAIQNQILEHAEVLWFQRSLFKPVVFDALELGRAVAGLLRQLPNRIMFHNPKSEPMSLMMPFVFLIGSDKGLGANRTSKSLLVIGALTEALNGARTAKRTVLFLS